MLILVVTGRSVGPDTEKSTLASKPSASPLSTEAGLAYLIVEGKNVSSNVNSNPEMAAQISRFVYLIDSEVKRKSSAPSKCTPYTSVVGHSVNEAREPANGMEEL